MLTADTNLTGNDLGDHDIDLATDIGVTPVGDGRSEGRAERPQGATKRADNGLPG